MKNSHFISYSETFYVHKMKFLKTTQTFIPFIVNVLSSILFHFILFSWTKYYFLQKFRKIYQIRKGNSAKMSLYIIVTSQHQQSSIIFYQIHIVIIKRLRSLYELTWKSSTYSPQINGILNFKVYIKCQYKIINLKILLR